MKQALADLFTSKKFLAALTAIIVYVAGRFGFDVDTAALDHIFAALLVYIGAQGVADHGKSAAQVRAAGAAAELAAERAPIGNPQAGRARLVTLTAIALAGALAWLVILIAPGCTATQARQTTAAGTVTALDCEAVHLDPAVLADAKTFALAEVQHWIAAGASPSSDAIRADLAPIKSDLFRCAIAGALAAVAVLTQSTPGTAVSALTAAGADPVATRAAFAVAARQAGWPAVKLPGGEAL